MRVLVRSALCLLSCIAILEACGGDDDGAAPPTTLLDGSAARSDSGSTLDGARADGTTSGPDTGSSRPDTGSPDTGARDGGSDADADAARVDADADDASNTADATDAADASLLGSGPFTIGFLGLNPGITLRPVKTVTFESPSSGEVDAWTSDAPYSDTFDHGTTKVSYVAGSPNAAFGSWSQGTAMGNGASLPFPGGAQAVYIIGQRPSSLPASGHPNKGTSITGAATADGTSSGEFQAIVDAEYQADGTAKIGYVLVVSVGDSSYTISTPGGFGDPASSDVVAGPASPTPYGFAKNTTVVSDGALCSGAPGNGTCSVSVQGFLSGPHGEDIAVFVHIFNGTAGAPQSVNAEALL